MPQPAAAAADSCRRRHVASRSRHPRADVASRVPFTLDADQASLFGDEWLTTEGGRVDDDCGVDLHRQMSRVLET